MPRLTPDEKRTKLENRISQLDTKLKALNAREKTTERKQDTRRKIIAGALALEHFSKNPGDTFSEKLRQLLHDYVDEKSRMLFPFLPPLPNAAESEKAKAEVTAPKPD